MVNRWRRRPSGVSCKLMPAARLALAEGLERGKCLAVRILVESIKDCNHALGVVHAMWQPVPGEFDDYIARPKDNLYRSLHTAVFAPDGRTFEVQIRTHEMHQQSEYGIAAHWRYKEQGKPDALLDEKIAWLRQALESGSETEDAGAFVAGAVAPR